MYLNVVDGVITHKIFSFSWRQREYVPFRADHPWIKRFKFFFRFFKWWCFFPFLLFFVLLFRFDPDIILYLVKSVEIKAPRRTFMFHSKRTLIVIWWVWHWIGGRNRVETGVISLPFPTQRAVYFRMQQMFVEKDNISILGGTPLAFKWSQLLALMSLRWDIRG